MKTNTTMTMIIALVAMIGLTGIGSAMDTNVQYNGDGSYYCTYDAYGTGSIGIHTYTSDGSDHLMSGWTNTEAHGEQWMVQGSGTVPNTGIDYSGTVIVREATVGGVGVGEDEAGYITTITTDDEGNVVISQAVYHDNAGYGSHVTTEQTVVVGSLVNIGQAQYNVTGVIAETEISGFAYGRNTTVSGMVMTMTGAELVNGSYSSDEYTYVLLAMDNGKMNLYTFSAAASIDPSVTVPWWFVFLPVAGMTLIANEEIHGACGQIVGVDANGVGVFAAGAGTDMHGAEFWMHENGVNSTYVHSMAQDPTMDMTTTFDGNFDAIGYIYAVNMTTPVPT